MTAFSLPEHIPELLGPAPLLRWESPERYERVLASMAQTVGPLGVIIARCDTRRDAILRETGRRRAFKVRMRAALPSLDAVDAQFDDLEGED